MDRSASLLDPLVDPVVGSDDPHRLAERTLKVVIALVNGRSGGVFAADERLSLFASRGIDQHVLDAVDTLWRRGKGQLMRRRPIYIPDCAADRELGPVTRGGPASVAVFPVFDADELVGLLYVDAAEPHFCAPNEVDRLARFARPLGRAVRREVEPISREARGWEAYLERTPVQDIQREKLLLLLKRNEWNIARVARLMGVTRRTVYLRLQRYNIPRERVPKRLRAAAS